METSLSAEKTIQGMSRHALVGLVTDILGALYDSEFRGNTETVFAIGELFEKEGIDLTAPREDGDTGN